MAVSVPHLERRKGFPKVRDPMRRMRPDHGAIFGPHTSSIRVFGVKKRHVRGLFRVEIFNDRNAWSAVSR
jgi:hypothetical protein